MTYTVSYEIDTYPIGLPEGATVTQKSLLPLELDNDRGRKIELRKRVTPGSFLSVSETALLGNYVDAALSVEDTRQLAHALLEAIGERPGAVKTVYTKDDEAPPASVTKLRDRDGDIWYRSRDGLWSTPDSFCGDSWSHVQNYAPLTVVD